MTAWLKLSGFQVDIAADIHAGWDSIQTNRYDLVITNHNPPYLSGLEFIHRLLAEQVPVPHILLTAKLRLKELNQNYALKFEWFVLVLTTTVLRKPFSTDELLESINMVLAQAAQLPPRTGAARYSIPDSVHAFDRMINELPCEEYFQESRCAEHCATT